MRKITGDGVPWVVVLFAANIFLQRLSIPYLDIPVITPLMVVWVAAALWFGVAEINARRLLLWLLATSISGCLVILQVLFVTNPFVSVNSWAFWVVIWMPLVIHLRHRGAGTYRRAVRGIGHVGAAVGALSTVFLLTQFAGFRYRDWLAEMLPAPLLVDGFNTSYPIVYGSEIYKSNAWIALEPSFLSFMLGVCVVAAVIAGLRWAEVSVIFIGMLATTAGSGLAIVMAFVVLSLLFGKGRRLLPYALPLVAVVMVFATTLMGESILSRVTEAGTSRSSTSLRAIEPYLHLWPEWTADPLAAILGRGPGASVWVVSNLGIDGLLVPSSAKVLFDYGIIGGTLLIMVMVAGFVRAPEPVFAWALAASMFTLQPAAPPLVVCVLVTASLWAPSALARVGQTRRDGHSRVDVPVLPSQSNAVSVAA